VSQDPFELLADLVARAPGRLVLPVRPRGARVDIATPLRLVDGLDLGAGRWVGVVEDADGDRWTVPLLLAGGGVRRAAPGDGVAEALVAAMAEHGRGRRERPGDTDDRRGRVDGSGPFVADAWDVESVRGERGITADQTNESVVVGERAVVKWSVSLPRPGVTGAQPAVARLSTIMATAFAGTPRPWGLLRYADGADGSAVRLLASVAEFLPGAEDGWDWAVDDVRRLARGEIAMDDSLVPANRLGELVALLHVALSSTGRDVADDRLVAGWTARAYDDLDAAVQLVDGPEGARLRSRAGRIALSFAVFRECVGTPLIDVHGDLHVGQVLRHGDPPDYSVTDFDGNPVVAPEQRSAPQPAALDVAGMLGSLDHVGRVVIKRTDGVDEELVRTWIAAAQSAFLDEYRSTLARMDSGDLLDERLLVPLRLQQECREFRYAVQHLPHWRYVPDAALIDLLPDGE
jgi:maltokinase